MSLIDYITFLLKNKNILDTNISLIYNQQNYENILTRIYQQLIFFENFNLKNCDIVDIGSGIGIHSNYFLIK
jgi:16S rRNA G527 N7-methylase RsmG